MRTSITAWKIDILTLTCILRLRLSPGSLPYPLIASKLLTHMPQHIYLLQKHTIPRSEKLKPGFYLGGWRMREWVERYLEERFEVAERWENESWVRAWGLECAAVDEIVRLMGLDGEGYGVWGEGEMEVQRRWRRSGDWRAGSRPCFCGKDEFRMFGAVSCEREEALRALRGGAVGGERDEVAEEERRVEKVRVGGDTAGFVDKQRDLEVEEVSSSGRKGEEKVLVAEEVVPLPLKEVLDRIRVPRVLKRGEKIPDNWWEEFE